MLTLHVHLDRKKRLAGFEQYTNIQLSVAKSNHIPENRKLNLDAFRGLMALAVVHCHTIIKFNPEDVSIHCHLMDSYVYFVVPAFYFISGYFIYQEFCRLKSSVTDRRLGDYKELLIKKFCRYIVPSIVFTLIPFFSLGIDLLCHLNTAHYFIPALFLIILFYCLLDRLIYNLSKRQQSVILITYALSTTILMYLIHDIPVFGYFHWRQALHENLFFILGVVAAINIEYFDRKCKSAITLLTLTIMYAACYALMFHFDNVIPHSVFKLIQRVIAPIAGTLTFYCFFTYISHYITAGTAVGRMAYYLGNRSLPLYIMEDLVFLPVFYFIDVNTTLHAELYALLAFILTTCGICILYDTLTGIPFLKRTVFGLYGSNPSKSETLPTIGSQKQE